MPLLMRHVVHFHRHFTHILAAAEVGQPALPGQPGALLLRATARCFLPVRWRPPPARPPDAFRLMSRKAQQPQCLETGREARLLFLLPFRGDPSGGTQGTLRALSGMCLIGCSGARASCQNFVPCGLPYRDFPAGQATPAPRLLAPFTPSKRRSVGGRRDRGRSPCWGPC
jgi:hypothetical protein